LAGVAEERKFFRVFRLDSPIGAGFFTEKAICALFLIDSERAIPGKGPFRTGTHARLSLTGNTEKNLLLFRPIRLDTNS
jgi:hypothetical protein